MSGESRAEASSTADMIGKYNRRRMTV